MSSRLQSSATFSRKQSGRRGHVLTPLSLNWKISALVLFVMLSVIWAFGIIAVAYPAIIVKLFSLDNERNIPTVFSALLLFGSAYICYVMAQEGRRRGVNVGMAAFFCFMAVDELISIHERLDKLFENNWPASYSSIALLDWQTFYIPVVLLGGIFWLYLLFQMRQDYAIVLMWIGGALSWFIAQLLEGIAWDWSAHRRIEGYIYYMITEEIFEMVGSSLFLIALLKRYRARPAQRTAAS